MGDYDFNTKDIINPKEILKKSLTPPIDEEVSSIVGKKVLALDPRLINLVMKHKTGDSEAPDNLFQNQKFIRDLKKTFNSVI